jgi:ATP-dependent Clp protease ATP-binding subunit ClpB
MFRPLDKESVRGIVQMQVDILAERLAEKNIDLTASKDAIEYLSEKGYDPQFGARPIKRLVQKEVLNTLSRQLLEGRINREEPLVLDVFDGQVVFRKPLEEELKNLIH